MLRAFNQHQVDYLLIGGMHFLIRHAPILTYDVDFWIEDSDLNRSRTERTLAALDAEWGRTDAEWGPVAGRPAGWLAAQSVFCLNSPHGAIDIFRAVHGLGDWSASWQSGVACITGGGTSYRGISDADMLQCQLSLDPAVRKNERIAILRRKLNTLP